MNDTALKRQPEAAAAARQAPILIVDDSPAMRGILVHRIRDAGFGDHPLLEASDGQEGLELCRERRPWMMLADWNMPGMSGVELIRAVRAAGSTAHLGLVSSLAAQAHDEAIRAGADFVLAKPVTVDALVAAFTPFVEEDRIIVPSAHAVAQVFGDLLGRGVAVECCYRAVLAGSRPVLVGLFGDGDALAGLLACDMDLASRLAAARAGASAAQAEEWAGSDLVPPAMKEPLPEALRSLSVLLARPGRPAPALKSVHWQLRELPQRAVCLAISPRAQAVYCADLAGYGGGGLCLCLA